MLLCLASCLSLPGVLLPVGAQPGFIKLSRALLCSCGWVLLKRGTWDSCKLVLWGVLGEYHWAGSQPGICTVAAGLLGEMSLLTIFPLLAWDW